MSSSSTPLENRRRLIILESASEQAASEPSTSEPPTSEPPTSEPATFSSWTDTNDSLPGYTTSGNRHEKHWGGSDLSISNYVGPSEWKISTTLGNIPPQKFCLSQLPALVSKQSFKPQCDETHVYILLTSGQATTGFISYMDSLFSGFGTDPGLPINIEWTFDHGEGLTTTLAVYEKHTGKLVAHKSFTDMHDNKDAFDRSYPRPYENDLITNGGPYTAGSVDPIRNAIDLGYSSSRGPMCIDEDYIYLYNGTAYHTAVWKVDKVTLEKVGSAYEVTEGLTPELINGLWGKNIMVIPGSEYGDKQPRLILFTNTHMQYEFHTANYYFENFSAINATLPGKGRLGFNSKVYCLKSTESEFILEWDFNCGPRMLKANDVLPEACFLQNSEEFDDSFYRILYNCEHLANTILSEGDALPGAAMVPKTAGVQRVLLQPSVNTGIFDSGSGLQNDLSFTSVPGSTATPGYITLAAGTEFLASSSYPVYSDYACTTRLTTPDNWTGTSDTGGVTVTGSYLISIRTPFVIKLFKSGANGFIIPNDDFAHGLNYYGSGIWSPASHDSTSKTIYFATGNAQYIPFEDEIRMMRASLIATKGQAWVDLNVGAYGHELDLWVGSFAKYTDARGNPSTARIFPGALTDTELFEEEVTGDWTGYELGEVGQVNFLKRTAALTTLRAISKAPKTPRQTRHVFDSAIAIDARTGGFKWALSFTPQDCYAYHQGLSGFNDRLSNKMKMFAGINGDNACGVMLYTTPSGCRRGYTAWKTGMQSFFDFDVPHEDQQSIGVAGDTSVGLNEGITVMKVPLMVDSAVDFLSNSGDINEDGWAALDNGPLGLNDSPPMAYWGHCASDGAFVYTTRLGTDIYSRVNNLLHNRTADGVLTAKYGDDLSLSEVKEAVGPAWADYIIRGEDGQLAVSVRNTNTYAAFFGYPAKSKEILVYSLHDGETGKKIWDVLLEPGPFAGDGGIRSTFGAVLLPNGIMSVGTPHQDLMWVNVWTAELVHTQKFLGNNPAYVGALVSDGMITALPLSGKFYNPSGKIHRFLDFSSPGGI